VYKIASKKSNIFAMNKASKKGTDVLDKQAKKKAESSAQGEASSESPRDTFSR
jgi:hypothetical protein